MVIYTVDVWGSGTMNEDASMVSLREIDEQNYLVAVFFLRALGIKETKWGVGREGLLLTRLYVMLFFFYVFCAGLSFFVDDGDEGMMLYSCCFWGLDDG